MDGISIDSLYDKFVASLESSQRDLARCLPHALKLAPMSAARWSDVFSHDVTLGAPRLLAEAFPEARPELVSAVTLAHALAVIEAFGRDRIADGQVVGKPELLALLDQVRAARNRALAVHDSKSEAELALADEHTQAAIAEERRLLAKVTPVQLGEYEQVSLGKQALGFPASLALSRAMGANREMLAKVRRMLEGVWLGLQIEDDVMDWEDDWRTGGAWAVCLASGRPEPSRVRDDSAGSDVVRRMVLTRGVLRVMLERSIAYYRTARRHARDLGAVQLAKWAEERESRLATLLPLEAKHAGFSIRARKLSPWAIEVLA
jgi:hypothetical protein